MQETAASPTISFKKPAVARKSLILAALLLAALLAGLLAYRAWLPTAHFERITPGELQQRYGIQVYLVGVTAAGGMVDLRMKIVDGQKAGLLLADPAHYPVLVSSSGALLTAPEDSQSLRGKLEDGGNVFLIFPNQQNAVKPGAPVSIRFGDLLVGPLAAR